MSNKETFKFHGFKDPGNYFCMGVMVFNVKKFAKFFSKCTSIINQELNL